jgi:hypothetical protein
MAPPLLDLPLLIVRPLIVASAVMFRTRDALLPLTATTLAPGPWRSRLSVIASSPEVNVMVPVTPESNWTLSAPA